MSTGQILMPTAIEVYAILTGELGSVTGYSDPDDIGTISHTTFLSVSIESIFSSSTVDFVVNLTGVDTAWDRVIVGRQTLAPRVFFRADAVVAGDQWSWGDGTSRVYPLSGGNKNSVVSFYR